MSAPTTLLEFCHARKVAGYCLVGVQGTILSIAVDLSALPYFLHPFLGPHQAGVPGRLVLVGSDCASWRRAVSRSLTHPQPKTRVIVRSGVWPSLLVGEAVRRWAGVGSERCFFFVRLSGRRGGPESKVGAVPPRPGLSVGDWIVLLACCSGVLGRPMSCALFATLSAGSCLCWKAGP